MNILDLPRLSSKNIERRAELLLRHFNADYFESIQPTPLNEIVSFLESSYDIKFVFDGILGFNQFNHRILGAFNPKKRIILVDGALKKDEAKFNFTLAHELGHLALHRNLKITYSESNIKPIDEPVIDNYSHHHKLETDQDWMEWQANYYASCLLMPSSIFTKQLIIFQKYIGIAKVGTIFLDNQECNRKDYNNLIFKLSEYFGVSWSAVEYRLNKLNLINDQRQSYKRIDEYGVDNFNINLYAASNDENPF